MQKIVYSAENKAPELLGSPVGRILHPRQNVLSPVPLPVLTGRPIQCQMIVHIHNLHCHRGSAYVYGETVAAGNGCLVTDRDPPVVRNSDDLVPLPGLLGHDLRVLFDLGLAGKNSFPDLLADGHRAFATSPLTSARQVYINPCRGSRLRYGGSGLHFCGPVLTEESDANGHGITYHKRPQ
ncbi:hypothetical protein SDC9_117634 [bioreactor metagenome]|uniref:Uncharacterized protein n=1 Tax=bioreactor metagenome TaxID=1076179 RepID=A0A645C016_9ZZZZ